MRVITVVCFILLLPSCQVTVEEDRASNPSTEEKENPTRDSDGKGNVKCASGVEEFSYRQSELARIYEANFSRYAPADIHACEVDADCVERKSFHYEPCGGMAWNTEAQAGFDSLKNSGEYKAVIQKLSQRSCPIELPYETSCAASTIKCVQKKCTRKEL